MALSSQREKSSNSSTVGCCGYREATERKAMIWAGVAIRGLGPKCNIKDT
ncbi:hypothetical protein TESG_00714 [Trichophyton tonsurans CBS 112818]|uniref:Uncharacterized protein n=2 Tax=Trichophyton TaxID=5550 RepID=F2Q5F9_TRIEC|nr:hypothetical protein TESG_00714 [Trichophyton tonsurans CBS 112818]EGE09383.1 hypothetical protein TEQG_08850 [Trichophyton equinum CBS 127.97]